MNEEVILEKVKIGCESVLGASAMQDMQVDSYENYMADSLTCRLTAYILGEKVEETIVTHSISYPASTWQHFKKDYFPEWLKKRFPVKMHYCKKHTTVAQIECYPKIEQIIPKDQRELRFTTFSYE